MNKLIKRIVAYKIWLFIGIFMQDITIASMDPRFSNIFWQQLRLRR